MRSTVDVGNKLITAEAPWIAVRSGLCRHVHVGRCRLLSDVPRDHEPYVSWWPHLWFNGYLMACMMVAGMAADDLIPQRRQTKDNLKRTLSIEEH